MSLYRNSEGYYDPTAGEALSNVIREYKAKQREERKRRERIMSRPRVYVVSRYAGDVEANVRKAKQYCRFAASKKTIPFASHLLYPRFIKDDDPKERELGLLFGLVWLRLCDEVWCFGTEHSEGMRAELHEARKLRIPIRYFTEEMEETI